MSAEIIVRPGREVQGWDTFLSEHPPYSIAVDGYVIGPPQSARTDRGPYANFDHHAGVNRLATLSSAQQVLRTIRVGLVDAYTLQGDYCPTVYVNDCDQDVAMAAYLLINAPDIDERRTKRTATPLRNLVDMQGDLDVTAGAYPYNPRTKLMRSIAWIFRPYTESRNAGDLQGLDPTLYRQIIGECCGRIGLYLAGRGEKVKLDTRYTIIGGGTGWSMFEEVGAEGRIGAFRKGIRAYVIHKGQRPSGTHDYSIGCASEFVPFDVQRIVTELNTIERCSPNASWGCTGSGLIGGSPRLRGSTIDPDTLASIVNDIIADSPHPSQ